MVALALEAIGAVCVVAGFALLAPFAGLLAAGVLLIAFGIATTRAGE